MKPERAHPRRDDYYARERQHYETIRSLKASLREGPAGSEHAGILYAIAQTYRLIRRCSNSLSWINKALDIDPGNAEYWIFKGDLLQSGRFCNYPEALDCYRRAAGILPHDTLPFLMAGDVCQKMHDLSGAVAAYDKALLIDPEEPAVLFRKGCAMTTLFHQKKRRTSRAARHPANSADEEAALLIEGLATFQRVLAIEPRNSDALYCIARICTIMQKYPEALAYYDSALQHYRRDREPPLQIWYSKAEVLEKMGRNAEADELYGRYYNELQRDLTRFMEERSR